jgi:hypothetical protein
MTGKLGNGARTLALVVAAGAVLVTAAGIAGPPLLTLIQHPDDPGGDGLPAAPAIAGRAYPGDPDKEADLVDAESQRVIDAQAAASAAAGRKVDVSRAFRVLTDRRATLVLPGRATPYTLAELAGTAPASVRATGSVFDVTENLLVARGATLQIAAGQTVRLASDASGFSTLVSAGGTIAAQGTAESRVLIESWNPAAGAPDAQTADGRAYLRSIGGALQLTATDVAGLGFWSGDTGGISAGGPSGSSGSAGAIGVGPDGTTAISIAAHPTGQGSVAIDDATVSGGAYGLYVDGVPGAKVTGSRFTGSLVDGIVLRAAADATVSGTRVADGARDGISVAGASSHVALRDDHVTGNARNGITLDGRAAASGPSEGGDSTSTALGTTVTAAQITGNARYGVELLGGREPSVTHSTVSGGLMGVVAHGGTVAPRITDDSIADQRQHGIAVLEGTKRAVIDGDRVARAAIGIHVRDAAATVSGNRVSDAAVDGISLVGSLTGTRVTSNTIIGTGAGSVDSTRAQHARIENNLVDGWVQSQSLSQVIASIFSPLTAIWSGILALVAFSVVWRLGSADRRSQRMPLQQFSSGVVSREAAGGTR